FEGHKTAKGTPIRMAELIRKWDATAIENLPHSKWRTIDGSNRPHNIYTIDVKSKKLGWTKKDQFILDRVFDTTFRRDLAFTINGLRNIRKNKKDESDNRLADANEERRKQKDYFVTGCDLVKVQDLIDEHCEHMGWRYDYIRGTDQINYGTSYPIVV